MKIDDGPIYSMVKKTFSQFRSLIGLLIVSTVLQLVWAIAVPVFEAPDEGAHWRYARYLHENWRLPVFSRELVEANSPPLYYLLVAPLAIDSAEPKLIIHKKNQPPSPPRMYENSISHFWPMRLGRFVSIVISTLTVLFCFMAGVEATGDRTTGLLVGGVVALLPQFTFRGMNVSNDSLVAMTCAVATYLVVRLIKRGFTWRLGIIAAIVTALAFLSKINALFLPIPLSLAILGTQGSWRVRLARLSVLGIALLIVAPWLIRNQVLYGDPLASHIMLTVVSNIVDTKPITSPYFLTTFPTLLLLSFIGIFGHMNLYLPDWLYLPFKLLAAMATLGYFWRGFRRQIDYRLTLILLTFPISSLAITVYINLNFSQPQGRYLFPALGAIALLVGLGLEGLPFWSKRLTYCLLGILLIVNLYIVGAIIVPAYWG